MIPFTTLEILLSVVSASVFGAIFAFLDIILEILSLEGEHIKRIREHIFGPQKIISIPKRVGTENEKTKEKYKYIGELITFFKVIIFTVGFILLSYYALDGVVRVYLLVFGVVFFLALRCLFEKSILKIADSLFLLLYGAFIILLRIFCRPTEYFVNKIRGIISDKKHGNTNN